MGPHPPCRFHKKKSRPGGGLRSRIRSQNGSFYLFYLGVEFLNQAPRRLILPFTFLPEVGRSRIRPQDGSFHLFTFLPGGGLRSRFNFQDVLLPFDLFPILRGGGLRFRSNPQDCSIYLYTFLPGAGLRFRIRS